MQNGVGSGRSRFMKACDNLVNVMGDAWHRVTTRPPEPTRPMPRPAWRSGYRANRLPTPLWAPVLAPIALELSCVLERAGDHAGVANLRVVERIISRPGSSFDEVSEGVLRLALAELRWIATRTRPTPAMARLLDQLQRQLLDREIQSYTRAIQALQKCGAAGAPGAQQAGGRR